MAPSKGRKKKADEAPIRKSFGLDAMNTSGRVTRAKFAKAKSAAGVKPLSIKLVRIKQNLPDAIAEQAKIVPKDQVSKRAVRDAETVETERDSAETVKPRSRKKIPAEEELSKPKKKTGKPTKASEDVEVESKAEKKTTGGRKKQEAKVISVETAGSSKAEKTEPVAGPSKGKGIRKKVDAKPAENEPKADTNKKVEQPLRRTARAKKEQKTEEKVAGNPKQKAKEAKVMEKPKPVAKTQNKAATSKEKEVEVKKVQPKPAAVKQKPAAAKKKEVPASSRARNRAKAPPKESEDVPVVAEETESESVSSDASDKENQVKDVPKNGPPQTIHGNSGEKKPIYKTINTKATEVPMKQLIVMDEEVAGPSTAVYDFSSSQGSLEKKPKKKRPRGLKAKATKAKGAKAKAKSPLWDPQALRRFQNKASKLQSIPAHIVSKVKQKELAKQAEYLQTSTPIRDRAVAELPAAENISCIENDDDDDDLEHQNEPDETVAEHHEEDIPETPAESRRKSVQADDSPWRSDETRVMLPTTRYINQSTTDHLPTYASEMIVKATPKRLKPPPRVPQAATSTDRGKSGAQTSNVAQKTTPESLNKSQMSKRTTADFTVKNFFGFELEDPDNSLEADEEVVQKHGEEALKKERERVKALVPKKKRPAAPISPIRRNRRVQQLTLEQAMPSTSRTAAKETPLVENLFEPERPAANRSYSRPKKPKLQESESEEDVLDEEEVADLTVEEQQILKYKKKQKEGKPKATTSKKDLEHQKELDEFCTSFNEMCDEVDKFEMMVE
ncbi:nucleolar protein dao-5-like [Phlebotomus argentipes]|uniref:nucleolar protein dao-5-like n=1 Tax=Phlebotomus argentipes TaxID=94469 RepID=UPI002892E33E|nr:nucleolar protein dao-5-like [Phlebotomus argentipes]